MTDAEQPQPEAGLPAASYPVTGVWAVAARVGLIGAICAIAFASLDPGQHVPRLLYSYHLEHFAAFYVAALVASAALPRTQLRKLGVGVVALALIMEFGQLLLARPFEAAYQNAIADIGGGFSALLPIAVDRFRRLFRPDSR